MFQNDPQASLPAAEVWVTSQLDPAVVDLTTFQLGSIALPSGTITPDPQYLLPVGPRQFQQDVDLGPAKPIILRIQTPRAPVG